MSIKNKTILILTAQFGAGHISAAKAIKDYILEEYSDSNILIENFLDASLPIMNKPMVKLYENNTKYTPGLYNYYYYLKKSFPFFNFKSSKYNVTTIIINKHGIITFVINTFFKIFNV